MRSSAIIFFYSVLCACQTDTIKQNVNDKSNMDDTGLQDNDTDFDTDNHTDPKTDTATDTTTDMGTDNDTDSGIFLAPI